MTCRAPKAARIHQTTPTISTSGGYAIALGALQFLQVVDTLSLYPPYNL
jgi:hypothetical protein